jgi:hypothetical protein
VKTLRDTSESGFTRIMQNFGLLVLIRCGNVFDIFVTTCISDSIEPCRLVLEVVGKHASSPCDVTLTAMIKGSRVDGTCGSSP